jgi:xanthine dehydrogenase YagS FAD-binding subunit
MRVFEYVRAATVNDALAQQGDKALAQQGEPSTSQQGQATAPNPAQHAPAAPLNGRRFLAGGTDLLTLMKADIVAPSVLVDLKRADDLPRGIEESADGLTIGALTTLSEIEHDPIVQQRYPALAQAIGQAATPQLRNMATIGGNLLQRPRCWYFRSSLFHCWLKGGSECHARDGENQHHAILGDAPCVAVHPSDAASALLAYGASVTLRGPAGERTMSVEDLFAEPTDERRTETTLRDGEILIDVRLPAPRPGTRSVYLKAMDRKVWAFALVGVAAVIEMDGDAISEARLVLSGVAPIPWRARAAEQALAGQPATPETFARAADAALSEARPLEHNGYKVPLARSLIVRALAGD